ncbi:leucine-rich repeat-containing protein [Trichonephila clavata]|uniref:Leucine-rich repeat-containing protein n=1 Tax=Trichonephila clavata TaxID=2740835 RepID=A0A8X6EX61_TRICU|nr:leucine-rich repeat-containing protein [Trichonephila clavata]
MAIHISSLPEEVLIQIFQSLTVHQRLIVSLVCKKWLHAMECHELLRDIEIKFLKEIEKPVALFSHMTRRFQCFSFSEITINKSIVEFLKQYSKQLIKLTFKNCEICPKYESEFQDEILHCDNLKCLSIVNSKVISLFPYLPNVTDVTLYLYPGVTDFIIFKLNKTLSNLESLSLNGFVLSNEVAYKSHKICEERIETDPSNQALSFEGLKKCIEKHSRTLKEINFVQLMLSSEFVLNIAEIKGLKLKRMTFPSYSFPFLIEKFCVTQSSLTYLDFSNSSKVTDEAILAVCKCLPNLETLILKNNHEIGDCISQILQLQHLTQLHITYCRKISQQRFCNAVSNLKTFKLKYLKLVCTEITDDSLFKLLMCNPNIEHLSITLSNISNKTLNMVSKTLIHLKTLKLCECRKISDSGLTGRYQCFPGPVCSAPLSNLKNLRMLTLIQIPLITNMGCANAIQFPKLECLILSRFEGFPFKNKFEEILRRQNPCLHSICISNYDIRHTSSLVEAIDSWPSASLSIIRSGHLGPRVVHPGARIGAQGPKLA